LTKFGKNDSISKKSSLKNQQFNASVPSWISGKIHSDVVEDETDYIKFGVNEYERPFKYVDLGTLSPSTWTNYPTKYKFFSFNLHASDYKINIARETYDILEWLGDIGGF
jgi:hypothetical protein